MYNQCMRLISQILEGCLDVFIICYEYYYIMKCFLDFKLFMFLTLTFFHLGSFSFSGLHLKSEYSVKKNV